MVARLVDQPICRGDAVVGYPDVPVGAETASEVAVVVVALVRRFVVTFGPSI